MMKTNTWSDRTNFSIEVKDRFLSNPHDVEIIKYIKKHKKILEVGCGQGRFMSLFPNITGLEYSQKFIDIAKKRGVKGKIYKGDAFDMSFKEGTFDMVFSNGLIEHYDKKQELVNEHVRVLKKNGLCLITVPSSGIDGYLVNLLRETVYKGTKKYNPHYLGERMERRQLLKLMEDSRLKDIKVYNVGLPVRGQPIAILRNIKRSKHKILSLYAFLLHSIAYTTTTKLFRRLTGDILVRLFSKKIGHALVGVGTKNNLVIKVYAFKNLICE